METFERIAGFDAREAWLDGGAIWDEPRRESYLYRTDVPKPLSIDQRVWPSIFALDGLPPPPDRFGYQALWADLAGLRRATTKSFEVRPLKPFHTVAVALVLGAYAARDTVDWDGIMPPATPDHRESGWPFLGYDVGDQWSLSVLMNCGFAPGWDDVAAMRARWRPLLNEHHLFKQLEHAIAFKQMSDERLKGDHAPCFVFGLWLVK